MCYATIHFDQVSTAISVMKEVAAWGREQGYRVWPDEWLTPEELITCGPAGEFLYRNHR